MDRIDKSVLMVTVWHHKALPSGVEAQICLSFLLKLMLNSFSCILLGARATHGTTDCFNDRLLLRRQIRIKFAGKG